MANSEREIRAIRLPASIRAAMIEHAKREFPRECCGLLSGRADRIEQIQELVNESTGDDEFHVEAGLFAAFRQMRQSNCELLAIYHSHPRERAYPSRKDIERNYYGDLCHVIISLAAAEPVIAGFRLLVDRVETVEILAD